MNATKVVIMVILAAACLLFGILWLGKASTVSKLTEDNIKLQKANDKAQKAVQDIQASLDEIDKNLSGLLFSPNEFPQAKPAELGAQLVSRINNLKYQIQLDKERISDLEAKLAKSNKQLNGIQATLSKLKSSVGDKEALINQLEGQLGDARMTMEQERNRSRDEISKREKVIAEKEQTIEEQNKDINAMYVVFGNRKELINRKIIDRKGGLLGIGKVSIMSNLIKLDEFTQFNLLDTQQITFPATKNGYSILSYQTANSYDIERSGKEYTLRITNPQEFRKQKFIVIELL